MKSILTQNTPLEVEQCPGITDVHGLQEKIERKWMRYGLSTVKNDEQ